VCGPFPFEWRLHVKADRVILTRYLATTSVPTLF
jgi:hypothetical protein